jgi:hypothetical protein
MAKNQPGYPENWSTLTPQQKRDWRLNRFAKGEGIPYVSKDAEQAYKVRAKRWVDAYNVTEPDQVPFNTGRRSPLSSQRGQLPYLYVRH